MMGTVFRKTFTKPLPEGAEMLTRKGERLARWKDHKNKTRTTSLAVGKDGSDRIVVRAGTYTAKYRDGSGVVVEKATGCRDETAARSVLAELERRAELVKARVLTSAEDAVADHQGTPLAEHFADYIDHQRSKGINETRVKNTESRLNRVAADCRFEWLSNLSGSALERWLAARKAEDMSAGARNGYREALVGFGNWCLERHRLNSSCCGKLDCRFPLSGIA